MTVVDAATFDRLAYQACAHPRGRTRLCLHDSHNEPVQQMVIALANHGYVPPHHGAGDGKTYTILAGRLALVIFTTEGALASATVLEAGGPRHLVHFAPQAWHTAVALSEAAVYLETAPGPYGGTAFAPWAPAEGTPAGEAFLAHLRGHAERGTG